MKGFDAHLWLRSFFIFNPVKKGVKMTVFLNYLSAYKGVTYLVIFLGKLCEVTLSSLRSQLIHKGQRLPGALVALLEYSIWLTITASILNSLNDDFIKLVLLVIAFALGHVCGSLLEEMMAFGYTTITSIFMNKKQAELASEALRAKGFSLTLIPAEGMNGSQRFALSIYTKRKHNQTIKDILYQVDPSCVITIQSIQSYRPKHHLRMIK